MAIKKSVPSRHEYEYEAMGKRFRTWCVEMFGTKAESARQFGKSQSNLDRYWKGLLPISSDLEKRMVELGASDEDLANIRFGRPMAGIIAALKGHPRYHPPSNMPDSEAKKMQDLLNLGEWLQEQGDLDTLLKLGRALLIKRKK